MPCRFRSVWKRPVGNVDGQKAIGSHKAWRSYLWPTPEKHIHPCGSRQGERTDVLFGQNVV